MAYRHGVYVSEVPTNILPPILSDAGIPVVFGAAPVNLTADPSAYVNRPVLAYSYAEAVAALGFQGVNADGKFDFGISEAIKSHFALFQVAPIILVNVLDPATHSATVTDSTATLVNGAVTLSAIGIMLGTLTVKSGTTALINNTDYTAAFDDNGKVVITRIPAGSITDPAATLTVSFTALDPSLVTPTDIIGGVGVNGKLTGLELIGEIFPRFRIVPGQILAPGFSGDSAVAAVMRAKAENINGHFKAIALIDVPTDGVGGVISYADVPEWKNTNNVTMPTQVVCWPKVKFGGEQYHMSTQLASLMCQVDGQNNNTPYVSPSNKNMQMDSCALADGSEVFLGNDQATYLNGNGIVTAINWIGGWRAWGNRTAVYPASSDPKDAFIPVRRMFNWVGNSLILTFWNRVDFPLNRRQIDTVVDSCNIWLNGLVAAGVLVGGRLEFLETENPVTDLMDGISRFHVYLTPPSPNREIDFILEYDPAYLNNLFVTE